MPPIFITGTDTEIGKTWVSCALLRGYAQAGVRAAGMKPVASGAERVNGNLRNADALALMDAGHGAPRYDDVNPYCFAPAIAPALAARQAGVVPQLGAVSAACQRLADDADRILIEGAGGWEVGVNDSEAWPDWVAAQSWPVLLVVGLRLGCVNHALLSARAIARTGHLLGWVANTLPGHYPFQDENVDWLDARMPAPRLGLVRQNQAVLPVGALEAALRAFAHERAVP